MHKVQRQVEENPFYGKRALFDLFQKGSEGTCSETAFKNSLSAAWAEARGERVLLELFYTVAFSIGDVQNRQHNVFGTQKVDNGGEAHREKFQWFLEWLRETDINQYYRFVESDAIRQYTTLDNIVGTRVKTAKGTTAIKDEWNALEKVDVSRIASYLARLIKKGSLVDKVTIAKFLANVRTSKRQKRDRKTNVLVRGGRPLQERTKRLMAKRAELYTELSKIMGWEFVGSNFVGLRKWKSEYNDGLESKLFSTGRIRSFNEQQFLELLNNAPSGARHRIRRRLLTADDKSKGKWPDQFATWFLNWEKAKESAQNEQRALSEKVRQGVASDDDKKRLREVKKEAKVNTGGTNMLEMLDAFLKNKTDDLQTQQLLDKINFQVPVLVAKDVSGSMTGLADKVATFMTTVAMLKNPDPECDNLAITFGTSCQIVTDKAKGIVQDNRFMQGRETIVNRLIDRTAKFSENLHCVAQATRNRGEGTDFSVVAKEIERWIALAPSESERQSRKEWLQRYPVFLVMSDGDFNNMSNAAQSLATFQQKMRHIAGWEGVVVIWDVCTSSNKSSGKFDGLENVVHYMGWNLGIVNTIFSKIHDLDIIDVYTPLKSLWLSNRYQLIRENVL